MLFTDYHIFKEQSKVTNQLLHKDFLDDSISILRFRGELLQNFRFRLKFQQSIQDSLEQPSTSLIEDHESNNLAQAKFVTTFENFCISQHIDSNTSFRNHLYYKFSNIDNLTLYWKLQTYQNVLKNSTIGVAYKAHDNFIARLQVQLKTLKFYWGFKSWYTMTSKQQNEKVHVGTSIQWLYSKETNLRLAKAMGWFQYQDLQMNISYQEDGYREFRLFKKYSDDLTIAYEFIRQPSEITYQYQKLMRFATHIKLTDKIDLQFKIDNNFKAQTCLKFHINDHIQLLLVSKIDLDVKQGTKRPPQFPIGFQFNYEKL